MVKAILFYISILVAALVLYGCGSSSSTLRGVNVTEVPDTRVHTINEASNEADVDLRLSALFRLEQHQSNADPVLLNARAVTHLQRGDHGQAIGLLREAIAVVLAKEHYMVSTINVRDQIAHQYTGSPVYTMKMSDIRPILRAMRTEIQQGRSNRVASAIMYGNFDVSTPILYPNSNANALVLQALHELSGTGAFSPTLISYIDPAKNLEEQQQTQIQILSENLITAGILHMDMAVITEAVALAETVPVRLQTQRLRYVIGTAKYLANQDDWTDYVAVGHRQMFR